MAYRPEIQPPPNIPDNPELYQWLVRLHDTLSFYIVKDRQNGRGLEYDELDQQEVTYEWMFLHGGI